MFKKVFKIFKPEITNIEKYRIVFFTKDGEKHEFNHLNYIDPNAISYSVDRWYLDVVAPKYLQDDDNYLYPIYNILKIKFVLISTIENVIEKYVCSNIGRVWYPEDTIEIYED